MQNEKTKYKNKARIKELDSEVKDPDLLIEESEEVKKIEDKKKKKTKKK